MKGALVFITVLVFASMTEAFSGRWAKNRAKGFRHRNAFHHPQGTFYKNIQRRIKNIFQLGLSTMMMMVVAVGTPVTKKLKLDTTPASVSGPIVIPILKSSWPAGHHTLTPTAMIAFVTTSMTILEYPVPLPK